MPDEALSITDKRTQATYEIPLFKGAVRAMDLRQIKTGPDDFGMMTYDPAFMNTASCQSAITFIDGDKGILRYRGLPDRGTGGELHVPRGGLSGAVTANCRPRLRLQGVGRRDHAPHDDPRDDQEVPGRLPLRCPPDGDADQHRGGALHGLSRSAKRARPEGARAADHAADRQDADHRGLRLPPQPRLPVRLSGQRPELHRELHEHAVEDGGAEVRRQSDHGARARHPVHPARRPRAELQHQRHARGGQFARRSVPRPPPPPRPLCPARCTAAPTKKCSRCWTRSAPRTTFPPTSRR